MSKSALERLCEKRHVRIESQYGGVEPSENFKDCHPWKVTLHYQKRRMTTPFFMGAALDREPTAADVLSCLISDATSFENASGFEDWCSDFGYDTDSRLAERTWKALEKQAPKIRRLLGDDFDEFLCAEH